MIEVYLLRVPDQLEYKLFQQLVKLVSKKKQERIDNYYRKEDAFRTLFADLLVRSLLIKKYRIANEEIEFQTNLYGKPYLCGFPKFSFNISHSDEWIVCAVDKTSIGVDIEKIQPIELDIVKCFFSKEENTDLLKVGSLRRIDYFYDLWTIKESFVKAVGKGLNIPLNSFTVKKYSDERIDILHNGTKSPYHIKQYPINDQYKLSICALNNHFPIQSKTINYTTLIQEMMPKNANSLNSK